jgi:outer membrane protein with beta-barrel domain
VLSYGIDAAYTLPVAPRIAPYIRGGVGQHAVYADVQATNSTDHVTGTHFMAGFGFNYAASDAIAVRFEVLDFLWNKWDRDELNPTDPAFQNTTFPEDNPDGVLWPKPSIIHNLRLALGVSFTPSGGGTR